MTVQWLTCCTIHGVEIWYDFEKISGTKHTQSGENVFQLCRIRCSHPLNPQFQRLLAFVTGK